MLTQDYINFGKYKGKSINDIQDMEYLKWALSAVKLKPIIKDNKLA